MTTPTSPSSGSIIARSGTLPPSLAGLDLGAAPAGRPLLDAVEYLRAVHAGGRRPGPPPTAFVPKGWSAQLKAADGSFDLTGYRLCVLDGLRRAIRRRDVFPVRSLRYADPRTGLLSGAAWEAARPVVCRTVGVSVSADEELGRLSRRLEMHARTGFADRFTHASEGGARASGARGLLTSAEGDAGAAGEA